MAAKKTTRKAKAKPAAAASADGRDRKTGRFLPGNPGGPGNPMAARVAEFRAALLRAITPEDIETAVAALRFEVKQGNVQAVKELLDRAIGKAVEADLIERIETLERMLAERAPAADAEPNAWA